jgi:stearoyl-CoA desaturase (delta-9 desaturase)
MNIAWFAVAFLTFYLWHTLGIGIGYHRLLSHRSFKCSKAVEYFFVFGAYLAMESSPVCWVVIHRAHHRSADQAADPHSPKHGWWHGYIGWMLKFRYGDDINAQKFAPDLLQDPVYRFLEQGGSLYWGYALCAMICVLFRILLLATFGPIVAVASICAGIAAQQAPLLLNVVSHMRKYGYRNFELGDESTNVWWLAALTMGEGWHNNHHAYPNSARSGLMKGEIDLSWSVLKFLNQINLVSEVFVPNSVGFGCRRD